jgi:imidazolonepropionase-like amidohydrolase
MKLRLFALALLALCAAQAPEQITAQTTAPATAQTTVIRAGRLLDPETGRVSLNQRIVVEGGKIRAVGPDVATPAGATVIDLSRSTVMPGLFDAHTHLCMSVNMERDRGSYYYTTLNDPDSYRAVQGVANARAMLESGFTTVRDVGNEGNYACVSVRQAVERGLVPGPTMLTAGRIVAPFGGQFAGYRLGIPIAFGTDAIHDLPQYTRGTQALTWLDSYVAAGLPPPAILKALTTTPARLLGVEAARGAIRPGLAADIIATNGNPLDDINALKHVSFVMKNGAVFKNENR